MTFTISPIKDERGLFVLMLNDAASLESIALLVSSEGECAALQDRLEFAAAKGML